MTTGSLSILNVGAGDIEITFNNHDDAEAQRAIKMLLDMRQQGYAILVRDPESGEYRRAAEIDATRGRYILLLPADATVPSDGEEVQTPKKRGRKSKKISVPIAKRHAVGVARSAGG